MTGASHSPLSVVAGRSNSHQVTIRRPLIDGHLHIQSGRCAPLPLLWESLSLEEISKKELDDLADFANTVYTANFVSMSQISRKSTIEIADDAMEENDSVIFDSKIGDINIGIMIVMPMDMEFGHYEGYEGVKIYKFENGVRHYLKREWVPWADKRKGHRVNWNVSKYGLIATPGGSSVIQKFEATRWIPRTDETDKMYHDWERQRKETEIAAVRYPWRLMPMYHFDPRRYCGKGEGTENWQDVLAKVATTSNTGLYTGIKMYCSLGYQPLDDHPNLRYMLDFYKDCALKKIPILVHNTPKGMVTHDREFYYYHHKANHSHLIEGGDSWLDFFQKNHVHPDAWEKVLIQVNDLTLCLAHFGGDAWEQHTNWFFGKRWQKSWVSKLIGLLKNYENVYTDISYFMIKKYEKKFQNVLTENREIHDKILFGTDWFMTKIDGYGMHKFITETKACLDNICDALNGGKEWRKNRSDPDVVDLWRKFTFDNPLRFYGLHQQEKIDNIAAAIKNNINIYYDEEIVKYNRRDIEINFNKGYRKLNKTIQFYNRNNNS